MGAHVFFARVADQEETFERGTQFKNKNEKLNHRDTETQSFLYHREHKAL